MRHSMACPRIVHVRLRERQLLARRDPDLQMHQIESGGQLGDRMFHLQPRIHFQEVEILLLVDQEFHRAGIGIVGRLRHFDGHFAHAAAHVGIDNRRRRFFQNFLVAALDRTLALSQPDRVAVFVGQHLHLDVAGIDDRLFDVNFAVAERALRLALRAFQRGPSSGRVCTRRIPLPPPPAAAFSITG